MTIRRNQFGSVLDFELVNRFPADLGISSGYVLISSSRTLSNEPLIKLSLSRGGGWFLRNPTENAGSPAGEMKYVPYRGTIESWNAAYENFGNPSELSQRLNIPWHAYAMQDLTFPSSDLPNFWKIDNAFDRAHGVITNYLLRFDVNTGPKMSTIPFQVFLQPEVQQIELRIFSNLDSLSGQYKFVVR